MVCRYSVNCTILAVPWTQNRSDAVHMRMLTILLPGLLWFSVAAGHVHCPKAECEATKQRIKKIQSKMRLGYSRAQGERLEAELRRLRALRSKKCR